ncbi:MAG: hypothetical protein JZD40_02455 [Sulfolobus sp.]|nr:hypothetical protein [Sulfolobus sp.]
MRKFALSSSRALSVATTFLLYLGLKLINSNRDLPAMIGFIVLTPYLFLEYTSTRSLVIIFFQSLGLLLLALLTLFLIAIIVGSIKVYKIVKESIKH